MGLARWADADAASAEQGLYDLPPLGQGAGHVSLLHMTDCHAQLMPIYFREPSVNLGLGDMSGQLPHLVGEHLLKTRRRAPRHAAGACLHLPRLREGRAALRQGRRLRAPGHPGQAPEGQPPRRAAARRRRHLAGLGDLAVDECAGHGRRLQAARRRRDDRPLGVHLRHGAGQGDRREGLRRQGRLRRAERQDQRLRRPGLQALRDARDQRRAASRSSARPSRTRRSPTRATWSPTGPSASRTTTCRRSSTRRAPRAPSWSCCCRTTAWTST